MPCFQIKLDGNPLAAAKQLAAYCREHEIEVIHAQYPRENIIALLSLDDDDTLLTNMANNVRVTSSSVSPKLS